MAAIHPRDALFSGAEPRFPIIPACDHYAGTEKLITKALELQRSRGGIFDVTMDLEDGAPQGRELEHAETVAQLAIAHAGAPGRRGVRIHSFAHPCWRRDAEIIGSRAGRAIAYVTLPKVGGVAEAREMIEYVHARGAHEVPVHVLIETHGALREVFEIASLPSVEVLDFGIMDFISDHHGAIPEEAMRSPGQFEHALVRRAKTEVVAAAISAGVVPAHNVTLDLKSREQTFADAKRARGELGFLRMWSIHPAQIDPILEAMMPDEGTTERAARVLLRAQARDWGPIDDEGRLYDRASYRYLWELLQRSHLAGARLADDVRAAFFGG